MWAGAMRRLGEFLESEAGEGEPLSEGSVTERGFARPRLHEGTGMPIADFCASRRAHWIQQAVNSVVDLAASVGHEAPVIVVSFGKGLTRTLGHCYAREHSDRQIAHIIISSSLEDPVEILGILTHEIAHAIDNCRSGHRGAFRGVCRDLGLEGGGASKRQFSATEWSPEGLMWAEMTVSELGPLEHDPIRPFERADDSGGTKRPGSRMLKVECPKCGYLVRTTASRLAEFGAPICPRCFIPLESEEVAGTEGDRTPPIAQILQNAFERLNGRMLRDFVFLVVTAHEMLVRELLEELERDRVRRLPRSVNRSSLLAATRDGLDRAV